MDTIYLLKILFLASAALVFSYYVLIPSARYLFKRIVSDIENAIK